MGFLGEAGGCMAGTPWRSQGRLGSIGILEEAGGCTVEVPEEAEWCMVGVPGEAGDLWRSQVRPRLPGGSRKRLTDAWWGPRGGAGGPYPIPTSLVMGMAWDPHLSPDVG